MFQLCGKQSIACNWFYISVNADTKKGIREGRITAETIIKKKEKKKKRPNITAEFEAFMF